MSMKKIFGSVNFRRIVNLAADSSKRYAKAGMSNFRTIAKTGAKNTAASAKSLAKAAAKNKKMTAAVVLLGGATVVGIVEKQKLEAQKIQVVAFVDTKQDGEDCTTIHLSERGALPPGSKIYFESDDNFESVPSIITNLLKSGAYANLELNQTEINVYIQNVFNILKDKKDGILSIDDNYNPVTTIDSFNPIMVIDNVEKENEIQLYDLLSECAKKSVLYMRIEVSLGQALTKVILDVVDKVKDKLEIPDNIKWIIIVTASVTTYSIASKISEYLGALLAAYVFYLLYKYFFLQ